MTGWRSIERGGVHLAVRDFGGTGRPFLLLHGLAGQSAEWSDTASWLADLGHVVALDARGHGRSDRRPADVSPSAAVADVVTVVEQLDLGPAVLIGQSLGGHTGFRVAADHPDLVRGLVVADASPDEGEPSAPAALRHALERWPVPFPGPADVAEYFGGATVFAQAWASGFEERDGGWWPLFDIDTLERTLAAAVGRPYWEVWDRVRCPTLVVLAGDGLVPRSVGSSMVERLPRARLLTFEGARHDLHLDRPVEWRAAIEAFLSELDDPR